MDGFFRNRAKAKPKHVGRRCSVASTRLRLASISEPCCVHVPAVARLRPRSCIIDGEAVKSMVEEPTPHPLVWGPSFAAVEPLLACVPADVSYPKRLEHKVVSLFPPRPRVLLKARVAPLGLRCDRRHSTAGMRAHGYDDAAIVPCLMSPDFDGAPGRRGEVNKQLTKVL